MFYGVLSDRCFPWNILAQGLQSCFLLRFACCFNFKKPTHPSPKLCFLFLLSLWWGIRLFISFLTCSSSPGTPWLSSYFTAVTFVPDHATFLLPGDWFSRPRCIRFRFASPWRLAFDIPAFPSTIPNIGNFAVSLRLAAFPSVFRTVDSSWRKPDQFSWTSPQKKRSPYDNIFLLIYLRAFYWGFDVHLKIQPNKAVGWDLWTQLYPASEKGNNIRPSASEVVLEIRRMEAKPLW